MEVANASHKLPKAAWGHVLLEFLRHDIADAPDPEMIEKHT
jgi:hypothetical protein